jgi:hypothetical protein
MKKNRTDLSYTFQQLKSRIDKFKNNLNKNKKNEKILEGGVTSNSKVKLLINSVNLFSKQNTINMQNYMIKVYFDEDHFKEVELSQDNIHMKHKLYIFSYSGT